MSRAIELASAAGGWRHESGTIEYIEHWALSVESVEAFYAAAREDGIRVAAKCCHTTPVLCGTFHERHVRDTTRYAIHAAILALLEKSK